MSSVLAGLTNQTVAVWGTGREGRATLAALPSSAQAVIISDDPDAKLVLAAAGQFDAPVLTPTQASIAPDLDVLVRSPGVCIHRDEIQAMRDSGTRITSLLELWLPNAPAGCVIGVTGTKGKSTATSLIADLIAATGHSVDVAGNMGVPPTQLRACDYAILEVSSYQAAGIAVSPHIGALTNLDVDHLPWHGSKLQYHRDKLQLFANSELSHLVVPPWAAQDVRASGASLRWDPFPYSIAASDGSLCRSGVSLLGLSGTAVAPEHLARNLAVACAAVDQALDIELDADLISDVLHHFALPRGRLEVVSTQDGITWVNDPLASNPLAAAAAVRTYREAPVVLIAGGDDRGVDPAPLVEAICDHGQVRAIVVLGSAGAAWKSLLGQHTDVLSATDDSLTAAIALVARIAQPGDAVLFSPGAPTPAGEGDWENRLQVFYGAVRDVTESAK